MMNNNNDCYVEPLKKDASAEERSSVTTTLLAIRGMGCPNCAHRVRNSLLGLNGVLEAEVNHVTAAAIVRYNPNLASVGQLTQAVVMAGGDGRHEYFAQPVG